ncbi:MAG: tetratricopeptide repeat protein [bacterium]|nr:tetratricopeptide repeat protein [bacterium]
MNEDEIYDQLHEAELLMNFGEMDQSIKILEDLARQFPENYHIISLLGECYLSMGKPDKAIKPLSWATKNFPPEEADEEEDEVTQALTEDDFVQDLKYMFLERKRFGVWVDHYLLGCAYARCQRFRPAIQHLNIANKMNPEDGEIIRNIGWVRCMQKKRATGRVLLRKAITLDPENALAYNDLGASYLFEGKLEEAEKWIKKAIELDPGDPFIHDTADRLENLQAYRTLFKKSPHPLTS